MRKFPREIRICLTCKDTFEVIVTSTQKYCSPNCMKRSKEKREKLHRFYKGKTYEEIYGSKAEEVRQHHKEGAKKWVRTEEAKANMSKAHLGITKETNPNLAWSEEAKERRRGPNNPNWQGGIGNLPYPPEFNDEFKKLVRERYNRTCMMCKLIREQVGHTLRVHHIDYDKDNLDPDNFVPLCLSCHGRTIGKKNRAYWTKVLQNIVDVNKSFVG